MAALRFVQARKSGVTPVSLAAFTRAPARISRSAIGQIVEMHRPVECRRAVALRRVHVDALLQQRLHRLGVPALDRVDETQIARGGEADARRQQHDPR